MPFACYVFFSSRFPVSAQMKTINLLEGLDSPTNLSIGVRVVEGLNNHMALSFGEYIVRINEQHTIGGLCSRVLDYDNRRKRRTH